MPTKYNESHIKSLVKAVSWRIIATTTTIIISYFVTGSVKYALSIGVIEAVAKVIIYYFHERTWVFLVRAKYKNKGL